MVLVRNQVKNDIYVLTENFSVRIGNMYNYIRKVKKESRIADQVYRSGTSIGANCSEARNAESRSDFVHKMNIALKEASETAYWIRLLHNLHILNDAEFESIYEDSQRIEAVLTKILNSAKEK